MKPDGLSAVWILPPVAFFMSLVGVRLLIPLLERPDLLDHPTARSSHSTPTPRGGGLVVVPVILVGWITVGGVGPSPPVSLWTAIVVASLLAALSWADDLGDLRVRWRLLAQGVAVLLGLLFFESPEAVFQGFFPYWLAVVGCAISWVCFINLFNFMDGIDGNAAGMAITLGIGFVALSTVGVASNLLSVLGAIIAAAFAGFMAWNWHPAKIFLGDVGSVPVGFMLGWLLLRLAAEGWWAPVLILPSFYIVDNAFTMISRALRTRRFWKPHREHTYQKAAFRGARHSTIVASILVGNVGLVMMALLSVKGSSTGGFLGAMGVLTVVFVYLTRLKRP
jgi:UDP-N-acetylmuramyl pentapeptide phosphotransferase/UDP-N-acetylglucosamine-1-phosphate transferase